MKHLFMAYSLHSKCDKNHCKESILAEVIVRDIVTCFIQDTVYNCWHTHLLNVLKMYLHTTRFRRKPQAFWHMTLSVDLKCHRVNKCCCCCCCYITSQHITHSKETENNRMSYHRQTLSEFVQLSRQWNKTLAAFQPDVPALYCEDELPQCCTAVTHSHQHRRPRRLLSLFKNKNYR